MAVSTQAEEAALLAVDMAAAERRIHSALDAHISDLRQQVESEERAKLSAEVQRQVSSQCMTPELEFSTHKQYEGDGVMSAIVACD